MSYWGFNKALQKSLSDAYANVKQENLEWDFELNFSFSSFL